MEVRVLSGALQTRRAGGPAGRYWEACPSWRRRLQYREEILDRADLGPLASSPAGRGVAALLCVERDPEACHRSLIAERLARRHAVTVSHIRPA